MKNPSFNLPKIWGFLILIIIGFILMRMTGVEPRNILESADRSKVSRTEIAQRAFITYTEDVSPNNPPAFLKQSTWGLLTDEVVLAMGGEPGFSDEFNGWGPFQLWSDGKGSFAIISRGPDRHLDTTKEMLDRLDPAQPLATRMAPLDKILYDPSNGSRSAGDIISVRWSDDASAQQTQPGH